MGKKPSDEEIAYWRELRATGLSYQQIADKSFVKFGIKRSAETVRKYTSDVPVSVEVEEDFSEEDEESGLEDEKDELEDATPDSEKKRKERNEIMKALNRGKTVNDLIEEGKYDYIQIDQVNMFYKKKFRIGRLRDLKEIFMREKVWDEEDWDAKEEDEHLDWGTDPYVNGLEELILKKDLAITERDKANEKKRFEIEARKQAEKRVDSLQEELKAKDKAFEAYKVEAKEKVDKAEKAEKEARICPKCGTFYATVKTVSR